MIAPQYGLSGHAPLEVGEAILHSGAKIAGLTTTAMIANPAAPNVISKGTSGTTSYSYYLVCHDRNGGATQPSPAGSNSTGNATLSAANYNQISWPPIDGCWSWDILKGNTNTALVTLQRPKLTGPSEPMLSFTDTGQPTSSYRLPTRNTSGDLELAGMMISKGISWPLPAQQAAAPRQAQRLSNSAQWIFLAGFRWQSNFTDQFRVHIVRTNA